jgi:hypothetical protein
MGQTTQCPKEKVQKNYLQNMTHKAKDRVTRTLPIPGGELRCSEKVSSPCSTSGTRRVTLVKNPVIRMLLKDKCILKDPVCFNF